jgi:hypothetical protein
MKYWIMEVQTGPSSPEWSGNAVKFNTKKAAEEWAFDLSMRWTMVRNFRVREKDWGSEDERLKYVDNVSSASSLELYGYPDHAQERRAMDLC